jgi:hypothetical protein
VSISSQEVRRRTADEEGPMPETESPNADNAHDEHMLTTVHVLAEAAGVPYEVEQVQCVQCDEVLREDRRRIAA